MLKLSTAQFNCSGWPCFKLLRHFRRAGASHSSALDKIHFQTAPHLKFERSVCLWRRHSFQTCSQ